MSQITKTLGYGISAVVEMDVFTRMLNDQIFDDEEIRLDQPAYGTYVSTYSYMGLAKSGTAQDSPTWFVIRRTIDSGQRTSHLQFRENIKWSERTIGW